MEKKKKLDVTTILLVVSLVIGLSLVLYPTISDWVNSYSQSRIIVSYSKIVSIIPKADYNKIWDDAVSYNEKYSSNAIAMSKMGEDLEEYEKSLNVDGNGIMGYVEIPSIKVSLPIYHGTSENVLDKGVGHLEWTSLPVGGVGTHSVISGHRGLPSAKLFTNLDKVTYGDIFTINVLDNVLTYEVDQIRIVDPFDVTELKPIDGADYCTLMTCTPYGINTHRLLVRGHRIENEEETIYARVSTDAVQVNEYLVALFLGSPIILIMLFILFVKDFGKGKNINSEQSGGEKI